MTHLYKWKVVKWRTKESVHSSFESGRPDVFCKKGVLKKFHKIYKRPQPATLLKKRLWHRCFPLNFVKVFSF